MTHRPFLGGRALAVGALFALMTSSGPVLGDTVEAGCMQDLAGFDLTCTANDVQIASAENIEILDTLSNPEDPGCAYLGDTVTFRATFKTVVTAKERYDIGLYFAIDGDPNGDGAISAFDANGVSTGDGCSVSTVDYLGDMADGRPYLDLDGIDDDTGLQDTCGDINKASNPLLPVIELTTVCVDPDGDGKLNLPNCTSWRQSGANEYCDSPYDTYPGSPSKCRCDVTFNVDIDVPSAKLLVSKTALPASVPEGSDAIVTFSVSVQNTGIDPSNYVALSSLNDSIYGDITNAGGAILSTTCDLADATQVTAVQPYSCSFEARPGLNANAFENETNVVTAEGTDKNGNFISGFDDATVVIENVPPAVTIVKTANPTQVVEPGGDVEFTVTVTNTSTSLQDPLTIETLVDDVYGDLIAQGDCSAPTGPLAVGEAYECSFTKMVAGGPGFVHMNVVTVQGSDDDAQPIPQGEEPSPDVEASDSATASVNDVPSEIQMVKTATPSSVLEPGGNVTFEFTVNNLSQVDTVTIDSLIDSIYGDLDGQGDCSVPQNIAPGNGYTCSITVFLSGNEGDSHTNLVTASGSDDDGNAVSANDSVTVNVNGVPPEASVLKTVQSVLATYELEITNDSLAEELSIDSIMDDQFGDVTLLPGTCGSLTSIAPGETVTCTFEAQVLSSPHTNTITVELSDDDGNSISRDDDATVSFQ